MKYFIKMLKHFWKICVHKYWVYKYCKLAGITWRGIVHDLSKFSPIEFFESVKYYQGTSSPIDAAKRENGYSMAWQHHKGRNKHHHEYWTDNYDSGTTPIEMPRKYMIEMFCDYIGAARAYMGKNFNWYSELQWWEKKRQNAMIHPNTKAQLNDLFLYAYSIDDFPTKEEIEECLKISNESCLLTFGKF